MLWSSYNWPYLPKLSQSSITRGGLSYKYAAFGGMATLKFYRIRYYKGVLIWLRHKRNQ